MKAEGSNLPTSVAHVTSHRTISRRRQLSVESVIRITCDLLEKKHKEIGKNSSSRDHGVLMDEEVDT